MMKSYIDRQFFTRAVGFLVCFVLFAACDGDDSVGPIFPSRIEGRVTGGAGNANALSKASGGVEGATVVIAQVQADGSLQTVSTASARTDVEGRFTVEISLSGVRNLVVVAEKNSVTWKAVVSSEVRGGTTVYCPPLSDETTVEAEVYAKIVADGRTNSVIFADIAFFVDATVAAKVKEDATAIGWLSAAIEAEATARSSASTHSSFGVSEVALTAIADARTRAQASLESSLHFAEDNQSGVDAAFESYYQATLAAYINSGVKTEVMAKVAEISMKMLIRSAVGLSSDARFAVTRRAAGIRAGATAAAVQATFISLGASQSEITAVASGGTVLVASIRGATTVDQIATAFRIYHDTIVNQLKARLSARASAIASADGAINSAGGAKGTFILALSTTPTVDVVVEVYSAFFSAVREVVVVALAGATSAELSTSVEILTLTNMQSDSTV